MNLIYGTYNPSKLESMKKTLEGLNINLIGLSSIDAEIIEADESGKEPLDNAIQKAKTYYRQLKKPVFSCDSGLYFEGVAEEDQPGVYIKRIKGNDFTYREMLEYYRDLASKYGGKLTAYYKNAICLVINEQEVYTYDGEDLQSEKFYLVDKPHECYREGFPLDSLSVEISSRKYYYDLKEDTTKNLGLRQGFIDFFIRCFNYEIREFKNEDADKIREIIQEDLIHINSKDYGDDIINYMCKMFDNRHIIDMSKEREMFVASLNDRVIATVSLATDTVYTLFVDRNFHGLGIGKELMKYIEKLSVTKGISLVKLPASITAIPFYDKLGYTGVKEVDSDKTGKVLVMEKKLIMN